MILARRHERAELRRTNSNESLLTGGSQGERLELLSALTGRRASAPIPFRAGVSGKRVNRDFERFASIWLRLLGSPAKGCNMQ
jgi:hypothetical protein